MFGFFNPARCVDKEDLLLAEIDRFGRQRAPTVDELEVCASNAPAHVHLPTPPCPCAHTPLPMRLPMFACPPCPTRRGGRLHGIACCIVLQPHKVSCPPPLAVHPLPNHLFVPAAASLPLPRSSQTSFPYTTACMTESMRIYPPSVVALRQAPAPMRLGGYALPAGTALQASPGRAVGLATVGRGTALRCAAHAAMPLENSGGRTC